MRNNFFFYDFLSFQNVFYTYINSSFENSSVLAFVRKNIRVAFSSGFPLASQKRSFGVGPGVFYNRSKSTGPFFFFFDDRSDTTTSEISVVAIENKIQRLGAPLRGTVRFNGFYHRRDTAIMPRR